MLEAELMRKDKIIDDLLASQEKPLMGKRQPETHLTTNLKRKVRELQGEVGQRKEEVELLKRNIKNTKTHETEIEIKLYMDECMRLRTQLEEVIKSKDTFADP
jgi:TolA-binding protein